MRTLTVSAGLVAFAISAFGADNQLTVSVTNPSKNEWKEAPVVVACPPGMTQPKSGLVQLEGPDKIVGQVDDLNKDGKPDELVFLVNLKAGETKLFKVGAEVEEKLQPRAHCGMYLPNEEIRGMEGPAWESDLIAFRIYWDKRNATDVFCKSKPILSLEQFAKKSHNYHQETEYGMDVLKVGTAVGIGGFGAFIDGKVEKVADAKREFKIVANGPIRAACDLIYTEWKAGDRKLSLTNRMSIVGGQNWAEGQVTIKAEDGKPLPEVVAGFVKHTTSTVLVQNKELGVVGRWGKQALGGGEVPNSGILGLGVIAEKKDIAEQAEDEVNTFFRLKAADGKVSYRYNADWEKQPNAAKSAEEYKAVLEKIAQLRPEVKVTSEKKESK